MAALVVAPGDVQPLLVPAVEVPRHDPACRLEDLADGAAAFLGFTEASPELVRHPEVLGPVMPAEGFVAGLMILFGHVSYLSLECAANPASRH